MNNLSFFLVALFFCLLFACTESSNPKKEEKQLISHDTQISKESFIPKDTSGSNNKDTFKLKPLDNPSILVSENFRNGRFFGKGNYLNLKGKIGNTPISVFLSVYKAIPGINETITYNQYHGFYYYDKYQEPIPLFCPSIAEDEQIILYENTFNELGIEWVLNKKGDRYFGRWYDLESDRKIDIELEVSPLSKQLTSHWLSKKINMGELNQNAKDYFALSQLQMLFPQNFDIGMIDKKLGMNIIWSIIPHFSNAQQAEWFSRPDTLLNTLQEQFEYFITTSLRENDLSVIQQHQFKDQFMSVVHHSDKLLSFMIERINDAAEGFEHGNQRFYNVSLPDWEQFKLEDLFIPGFETELEKQIRIHAKRKFSKGVFKEMELNVEKAGIGDNYAITGKGIWFSYPKGYFNDLDHYEHKLFVPFSSLKTIME